MVGSGAVVVSGGKRSACGDGVAGAGADVVWEYCRRWADFGL